MKISSVVLWICLPVSVSLLNACSGVDKRVEDRTAKETPAQERGALMARGFDTWAGSAQIDVDQKSKLWTLHSSTAREAFRIRDEITKAKSAMFKELANGGSDKEMINGLKNKIVKLDQERMDIMFKALDSVQRILGNGRESKEYYLYLEELETRGFDGR